MQGRPLRQVLENDTPLREAALFGVFGGHVCCTDGRYVYMRASVPENAPLYEYTLMPTHMRSRFGVEELRDIQLAEPFSFTKGCRTMKLACCASPGKGKGDTFYNTSSFGNLLFDLQTDPGQKSPLRDPETERRMIALMTELMRQNDAPPEQFRRLGLA